VDLLRIAILEQKSGPKAPIGAGLSAASSGAVVWSSVLVRVAVFHAYQRHSSEGHSSIG
jgi:hypothetical protein